MKRLRATALGLALTGLAACGAAGPDYRLPDEAVINRPHVQGELAGEVGAPGTERREDLPAQWWKLYDDALLDRLIGQALQANAGLREADANLRRAAAIYQVARSAGGWDESVDLSVSRAQISAESLLQTEPLPPFNVAVGGFSVSYAFDFFGKIRRGAEAAGADVQVSQAAMDLARITVVAEVTREYVERCHASHELNVTQHLLALQERSQEIAQRMLDAGRGTATDVARARAQAELVRAALPPLTARRNAADYALAALLGGTPADLPPEVAACEDAPQLRRPIPVGDGAALLRRRPDVRAAERRLAAATARIGVATASLYPDISIGASIGANGLLEDFGNDLTRSWSIGPLVSWSIPGNGAHARVLAAQAGADAALAAFDQTVLDSLRDTQTALDAYVQRLRRGAALQQALDASAQAAQQNRLLYEAGRVPYLNSLDAERTYVQAQTSAAENDAQLSLDQVNLFLALGGGWQQEGPPPPH
ncbi:efflux transporter outer membrane subunit [Solimonas soli]|uniref:efflux transporter outer membrane subunit n=1 Tax=Solimonas soli TaxID=413479 RepID=UPI0004888059|nr:TolC family protein [Solimonas soli]